MSNKSRIIHSGVNLFVRFASMVPKLLFSIFCLRFLSIVEFGEYIIFISGMSFVLLLIGLDFYSFANRELLNIDDQERGSYLGQQLVTTISFATIMLVPFTAFMSVFLKAEFLIFFFLTTIFEYISTEIYRILTVLSRPVLANILMFLRSGFWILLLLSIWTIDDGANISFSLYSVLWFQLVFAISGAIVSFVSLNRLYSFSIFKATYFDVDYIKIGLRISMVFYAVTFFYKLIELSGRFIIDYTLGDDLTGVFGFATQMGISLQLIVASSITMIEYPKLISAESNSDNELALKIKKGMLVNTAFLTFICLVGLFVVEDFLLNIINNDVIRKYKYIIWCSCVVNIVFIYGVIYQFVLYSKNIDSVIFKSAGYACVVYLFAIGIGWLVLKNSLMEVVLMAQLLSYSFMLIYRYLYIRRAEKIQIER